MNFIRLQVLGYKPAELAMSYIVEHWDVSKTQHAFLECPGGNGHILSHKVELACCRNSYYMHLGCTIVLLIGFPCVIATYCMLLCCQGSAVEQAAHDVHETLRF